jgi:Zn-finger nucleic acid-binding protein
MQCPIDQTDLVMTERQGIEIDYCPKCRGVWLDRGELDKMIERSHTAMPQTTPFRDDDDRYAPDDRDRRYEGSRSPQGGMLGKVGEALGRRMDDDDDHRRYGDDDRHDRSDRYGRPRRKKKESFLDDLFDF